ncbi:hypothetical protein LTR36_007173 [Oleoguttula mirabilis]|uniref:Uncharacterized protein n=1 Tax=Oleoguttula mirabilis TaxID=1507867 RepID=A0AAV9JAS9_9PEZI|nr:hypothetical protein LTR36_007173 [Oleoguttula mirabilis]
MQQLSAQAFSGNAFDLTTPFADDHSWPPAVVPPPAPFPAYSVAGTFNPPLQDHDFLYPPQASAYPTSMQQYPPAQPFLRDFSSPTSPFLNHHCSTPAPDTPTTWFPADPMASVTNPLLHPLRNEAIVPPYQGLPYLIYIRQLRAQAARESVRDMTSLSTDQHSASASVLQSTSIPADPIAAAFSPLPNPLLYNSPVAALEGEPEGCWHLFEGAAEELFSQNFLTEPTSSASGDAYAQSYPAPGIEAVHDPLPDVFTTLPGSPLSMTSTPASEDVQLGQMRMWEEANEKLGRQDVAAKHGMRATGTVYVQPDASSGSQMVQRTFEVSPATKVAPKVSSAIDTTPAGQMPPQPRASRVAGSQPLQASNAAPAGQQSLQPQVGGAGTILPAARGELFEEFRPEDYQHNRGVFQFLPFLERYAHLGQVEETLHRYIRGVLTHSSASFSGDNNSTHRSNLLRFAHRLLKRALVCLGRYVAAQLAMARRRHVGHEFTRYSTFFCFGRTPIRSAEFAQEDQLFKLE